MDFLFGLLDESTFIYDKKVECPICRKEIITKQVRTGKARFLGTEDDLRPKYEGIDTIKYDVWQCYYCGYAASNREFENVTPRQKKFIKDKIGRKYSAADEYQYLDKYSYEVAIKRCKMALLTAMVKPSKVSEQAYLCLKLCWLYRGALEENQKTNTLSKESIQNYHNKEDEFMHKAYAGFSYALSNEYPPICGMDEMTINYLVAVLAHKCDDNENALKYAYSIIGSKTVSSKLKNKARDFLDEIKKIQTEDKENKDKEDKEN